MMNRSWLRGVLLLIAATLTIGCGKKDGSGASGQGDGDSGVRTTQGALTLCDENPATVAGALCVQSDDCACGTSCLFGRCEVGCLSNDDCPTDRVCSQFGTCEVGAEAPVGMGGTAALVPPRVPPLSPPQDDRVSFAQSFLSLAEGGRGHLVVRVDSPMELKVRASTPFLVSCLPDEDFSTECTLPADALEGLTAQVAVTQDEQAEGTSAIGRVTVYSRNRRASATVRISQSSEPTAAVTAGRYRGRLAIESRGTPNGGTRALSVDPFVELEIYESGSVVLTDLSGRLGLGEATNNRLHGRLEGSPDDGWTLSLLSARVLESDAPGGAEVALDFDPAPLTPTGGHLSAQLVGRYLGSSAQSDSEHAPVLIGALRVVYEAPLEENPPDVGDDFLVRNPLERALALSTVEHAVGLRAACAHDAVTCAQHVLCRQDGDSLAVGELDPPYLFEAPGDGPYADLSCSTGEALAFPFLDLPDGTAPPTLTSTVDACIDDLREFFEGGIPEETAGEDELDSLLASAGCVSVYRLWAALGILQESETPDAANRALTNRLWTQWFQMLTATLNGRREIERAATAGDVVEPSLTLLETLELSLEASELVLHPRLNRTLVEQEGDTLALTDYRVAFGINDEGTSGLHQTPVFASMLDFLSAQSRVIALLGHRTCGGTSVNAEAALIETTESVQSRAAVLLGTIEQLKARAGSVDPDGDWEAAWLRSVSSYVAASNEMNQVVEACREGRNPLGISDLDLPLVFRSPDGTAERFSAASDFLIGTSPGSNAWVPSAISEAQEALDDVREAWLASVDRQLMTEKLQDDQEDREEFIRLSYGEKIVSACGEASGLTARDALESNVSPGSCYFAPECRGDDLVHASVRSPGDVAYELCVFGRLQQAEGPVRTGNQRHETALQFAEMLSAQDDSTIPFSRDGVDFCYYDMFGGSICTGVVGNHTNASDGRDEVGAALDGPTIEEISAGCERVRASIDGERPFSIPTTCEFTEDCPVGFLCVENTCEPEVGQNPDASCFSGSLGENALSLRSAALAVDEAKAEMSELNERYDIAMESCFILRAGNAAWAAELDNHHENMNRLRDAKAAADATAGALQAASSFFNPFKGGPLSGLLTAGSKAAKISSANIKGKMEEARERHDASVQRIQARRDEAICFNDARIHLVGARSAALRIEAALNDSSTSMLKVQNELATLQRIIEDGRAELEREKAGAIVPLEHDFYLDEKVDYYERKFRIAQRATYLSVRAFEYEYQACESLRGEVIEATNPQALDAVVDSLLASSSAATLDGRRPSDGLAVVSLRDDILRIASHEDRNDLHQLSAAERFRVLVTSPRFAVFDEAGDYAGQRIPFSLAPWGSGDAVSLLNGASCAERLWSVNASLLGEDFMVDRESSFVEVTLQKRNTFFSTLCSGACAEGDGEGRQLASIRPSQNLFADPFFGSATGIDSSSGEDQAFSSARIRAFAQIERATLETDDYENGDTSELAGRGLWGDYALFIRAADLSVDGSPGLSLHHLDDILLRFDYVSVAQD